MALSALRGASLVAVLGRSLAGAPRLQGAREQARALSSALAQVGARHGMRLLASGPPPPPGAVLVANHVSYLDPVALLALAPAVPIAKAQIGRWPLVGAAARRLGVILVQRASPASRVRALRAAIRALADGARVLNFPEGTTTDGGQVAGFQRGIFGAARITGAPIVPVAIAFHPPELAWVGDASFLPHYARAAGLPGFTCRVAWGEPIHPGAAGAAEMAAIARARVLELLGRIRHESGERHRIPAPRAEPVLPPAAG